MKSNAHINSKMKKYLALIGICFGLGSPSVFAGLDAGTIKNLDLYTCRDLASFMARLGGESFRFDAACVDFSVRISFTPAYFVIPGTLYDVGSICYSSAFGCQNGVSALAQMTNENISVHSSCGISSTRVCPVDLPYGLTLKAAVLR